MKRKLTSLALALFLTVSAFAKQVVVVVPVSDGEPRLTEVIKLLEKGGRVIAATAVTDSDSIQAFGKPKQSYTTCIVYIIETNS